MAKWMTSLCLLIAELLVLSVISVASNLIRISVVSLEQIFRGPCQKLEKLGLFGSSAALHLSRFPKTGRDAAVRTWRLAVVACYQLCGSDGFVESNSILEPFASLAMSHFVQRILMSVRLSSCEVKA